MRLSLEGHKKVKSPQLFFKIMQETLKVPSGNDMTVQVTWSKGNQATQTKQLKTHDFIFLQSTREPPPTQPLVQGGETNLREGSQEACLTTLSQKLSHTQVQPRR